MSHLNPNALTTPETVSDELGLPIHLDPDEYRRISRYINIASAVFQGEIGYEIHRQEDAVSTVSQPRGSRKLVVTKHAPITEVKSIKLGDTEFDASTYKIVDEWHGWIERRAASWPSTEYSQNGIRQYTHGEASRYELTYDCGYVTPQQAIDDPTLTRDLPYDIEQAVITYACFLHQRAGQDMGVSSKSTQDWSVSYDTAHAVPPIFTGTVNKYRRMVA